MTWRKALVRALQLVFVLAVFVYGGRKIAAAWADAQQRGGLRLADLGWSQLAVATLLVLATYALLIQLWRYVLRSWGERLAFVDAAAVWFVSSLGRYVPGRVTQFLAMGAMSRARGISATAAAGSAVLNVLLNIVAGLLVALALAGPQLDRIRPGSAMLAAVLAGVAMAGLLLLPWLLPRLVTIAGRLFRRQLPAVRMPARAIWLTAVGNVGAWVLYGLAFRFFAAGVLGSAAGAPGAYIAVYTGSYVVGYLALLTPGGLGVREATMVTMLTGFGLAAEPQAWLLAFASRLWLLVLEVLPGVLFLALSALRRSSPLTSGDASP